jgi:hypothetical protein
VLFTTFDEDHIVNGDAVSDDPMTSKRVEALAAEVSGNEGPLFEQLPEGWVTRYIATLSQDIELAEIGEERGF